MTTPANLQIKGRRLKIGVVANEFFDLGYSRMGGFGWATRQLAACFRGDPSLGADIVFIDAESGRPDSSTATLHGVPVIAHPERPDFAERVHGERIDLLLAIDYRKNYRRIFRTLARVPILVWARDPRGPDDAERIRSVRLPGDDRMPAGLESPDTTSLSELASRHWWNRRMVFGSPSLSLRSRAEKAYDLPRLNVALLPNILDLEPGTVVKSEKPSVVFLARLDSYKRPWLFAALASHFPDVDFLFLGQSHHGPADIAWRPVNLPQNVRLMGHVDGAEKTALLAQAWVLVNTSIHEGLAVSFLEALKCETPILSCIDTEEVASRFGVYVGTFNGSGMDAVPAFVTGLRELLDSPPRRAQLGREGRDWVTRVHNRERFLEAFRSLCVDARVL